MLKLLMHPKADAVICTATLVLFVAMCLHIGLSKRSAMDAPYTCTTDSECIDQCMARGNTFEQCDAFMEPRQ